MKKKPVNNNIWMLIYWVVAVVLAWIFKGNDLPPLGFAVIIIGIALPLFIFIFLIWMLVEKRKNKINWYKKWSYWVYMIIFLAVVVLILISGGPLSAMFFASSLAFLVLLLLPVFLR